MQRWDFSTTFLFLLHLEHLVLFPPIKFLVEPTDKTKRFEKDKLLQEHINGLPAELLCIDAENNYWLDLLCLGRCLPFLIDDLTELLIHRDISLDSLLENKVAFMPDDSFENTVIEYQIRAENVLIPGNWMIGLGDRKPSQVSKHIPAPLLVLPFHLTHIHLLACSTTELFITRTQQVYKQQEILSSVKSPFLIIVYDLSWNQLAISTTNLSNEELLSLKNTWQQLKLPSGNIEKYNEQLSGVNWDNIISKPKASLLQSPQELAEIYAITLKIQEEKEDQAVLDYLWSVFSLVLQNIDIYTDPESRAIIRRLLNLRGIYYRKVGNVKKSEATLKKALGFCDNHEGKQEIYYNLGYTKLARISNSYGLLSNPSVLKEEYQILQFPLHPKVKTEKDLRECYELFSKCADNSYKFSQLGMTTMLLGGTFPHLLCTERICFLNEAIETFDKAIALGIPSEVNASFQQKKKNCLTLIAELKKHTQKWRLRRKTSKLLIGEAK